MKGHAGSSYIDNLGVFENSPRFNPNKAETFVTNWQSGHGFTRGSANGTQEDDTTVYIKGSQSLKHTTVGTGNSCFSSKTGMTAMDMSGKMFKLWVCIDDPTNTAELWLYASSDSFTNYYTWKITDDISMMKANVWTPVIFSFGEATSTLSPNRAAITAIRVRVNDKNSTIVHAWYGGLSIISEPTAGCVTLTFDDGWDSQYSEARKKMDAYNFPGVAYITPSKVGTTNYMTLAQIKELRDAHNWDIAGHHDTNLTTLPTSEAETVLIGVKKWLLSNGFIKGSSHFAYPNGGFSADIIDIAKKYFTTGRTIVSFAETLPPSNYMALKVLLVIDSTTTASIATAVDQARTNKEWLIIVFHKIVTSPGATTEYSIANFSTVIDDIATDGIAVKTITDVMHGTF